MKKLYVLLVMAVMSCLCLSASTAYFTNPDNWENVYAYYWGGDVSKPGWPGELMTKDGDLWKINISGTPANIIFNPGGDDGKTGDLDFVDGATYDKNGVVGAAPTLSVGVAGSFNGWSTSANTTSDLTDNCGVVIIDNWDNGNDGFKVIVKNGGTTTWYSNGSTDVPVNGTWQDTDGGENMKLASEANGKKVKFTIAADNGHFKVEIVEDAEPTSYTVSYDNSVSGWADVYCTVTDSSDQTIVNNQKMTEPLDGNTWTLTFETTLTPANIKFGNNDDAETANFVFEDGATYNNEGIVKDIIMYALIDSDTYDYVSIICNNEAATETFIEEGWDAVYQAGPTFTFKIKDCTCKSFFVMAQNQTQVGLNTFYSAGVQLAQNTAAAVTAYAEAEMGSLVPTTLPDDVEGKTVTVAFNTTNMTITADWYTPYFINVAFKAPNTWNECWAYVWADGSTPLWFQMTKYVAASVAARAESTTTRYTLTNAECTFEPTGIIFVNQGNWNDGKQQTKDGTFENNTTYTTTGSTDGDGKLLFGATEPGTTGLESVEAEAMQAVYYNLQGVRVANPANGIYIVVRGSKVAKEYIR